MPLPVIVVFSYILLWFSALCLSLTIFRFRLRPLMMKISLSTMILTYVSACIQFSPYLYLIAIIQFISMLLMFWIIFRIPFHYSVIMAIVSFGLLTVAEWGMNWSVPSTFIQNIAVSNKLTYFISGMALCLFNLILQLVLKFTRIGFSFVPQSGLEQPLNRAEKRFVKKALPLAAVIFLFNGLAYQHHPSMYFLFVPGFMLAVLGLVLRVSYKWESVD